MLKPRIEDDMTHRMTEPDGAEMPSQVWQPIETAPKHKDDVLVYCADSGEQFVAFWRHGDDWQYAWGGDVEKADIIVCRPTHWRPLPPPPGAQPDPTPVPSTDATGGTVSEANIAALNALVAIANFPITNPDMNVEAFNIRKIAADFFEGYSTLGMPRQRTALRSDQGER